jgi:hypothetical protein
MAKKSQTKKTTSAKNKSKSAKKPQSKSKSKTTKPEITKNQSKAVDYKDLFYGTISALAVYVFALWAIDSGSLWVYGLMFAALYYAVHFFRLFIRNKFFNNDKTRKTK